MVLAKLYSSPSEMNLIRVKFAGTFSTDLPEFARFARAHIT